jgi:hypothetical protein
MSGRSQLRPDFIFRPIVRTMLSSSASLIKYLLACTFCLSLAGCLAAPDKVVRGVLHGDLTWRGEVFVAGDVILGDDVKLVILPGTRVRFLAADAGPGGLVEHPHFPGSELIVKGQIHAVGTPSAPIIFEASESEAPAGFWGAVNLEGSQEAVFAYCIFRQADSAVHSRDSQVSIEQSVFENNLVGIRFHDSEILIEHNLLRNNHTGIRFHFGSPVICENEFFGNNVNLFVTSHPRDYRIENNSFGKPAEYQVVFGEDVPDNVNMPRNYWAHPETSPLNDYFYDGRRSPYLGQVLFEAQRSSPSPRAGLSWSP